MQRGRTEQAERFEVVGCAVAFILREAVLRIELIELEHAAVAIDFGEDGRGSDRDGARVAVNDRFLFDGQIEFDGVEQKVIGKGTQLRNSRNHRLAAGLINIPGVDAAGVDFGDGPGERVLADTAGELDAAFVREFFRVIEADDAALGIEDDSSGEHGTEEGTAASFVEAGDALPTVLSRDALVARAAEPCHRAGL